MSPLKSVGFKQEKGKGPTVIQENLEILIKANNLLCASTPAKRKGLFINETVSKLVVFDPLVIFFVKWCHSNVFTLVKFISPFDSFLSTCLLD